MISESLDLKYSICQKFFLRILIPLPATFGLGSSKDCDKELNFFKDNDVQIYKNKDLAQIIKSFKDQDFCSILIEAGPKLANSFLELGLVDEIISYTSNNELGDKAVSWFKENNAIENYGFKLESSYKIDSDIKEVFKKNG